jgi:ribosomal protein L37AE/L43A
MRNYGAKGQVKNGDYLSLGTYYGFYGTSAKKKAQDLATQLNSRISCVDNNKVEKIIEKTLKTNLDTCAKCGCKNLITTEVAHNRRWIFEYQDYSRPPPQNIPQTTP